MSNQRRKRSEARQGLHQYLMVLYNSYLDEHSTENAKSFVVDIIKEQLEYFSGDELPSGNPVEQIENIKKSISAKSDSSMSEHERYVQIEDLSALTQAIDVIEKHLERE